MKKLRIGWFNLTCCEGCSITFIELMNRYFFQWKEKIDFVYIKMLKSKNELKNLDVAFVEGAVSSKKEEEKLRKIKDNTKKVVAVGICAANGLPAAQRNYFSKEQLQRIAPFLKHHKLNKQIEPLKKFIKIDNTILGCPMDEKIFLTILQDYIKEFGVE